MRGRQLLAAWRTTGATTALQEAVMRAMWAPRRRMAVAPRQVHLDVRTALLDMVATALRALLAQHVALTRTARLRLTRVHASHATRMPKLLVVWRTTAATTALQEAAMPDTMVPL